MPIIFATFGFMVGLIEAFLYNVFARWFGGIEIDVEQECNGRRKNVGLFAFAERCTKMQPDPDTRGVPNLR